MNRENILFGVVGLLLGYVVAFHLVVHINQTNAPGGADSLPEGHPAVAASAGGDAQGAKAAEAAARAAEGSPKDFDAQVKAAAAYMDAGGFNEASDFLARASALKPDDLDVRSELAVSYFMSRPPQKERAVAELRRNLEADPGHLPSLHNLTRMLIETERLDEAQSTLERLEKADPNYKQLPQLRAEIESARRAAKQSGPAAGKGAKKSPTD